MNRRDLVLFLGIEIFAIVWAAAAFSLLTSHLFAGALAGGYFVVSGIFMLSRANHWPMKWTSLTWYCLYVHVFAVALPMLVSRFAQMSLNFEEVQIFGISGPVFHNISTAVFSLLIFATVLDYARSWWATRR